MLIFHIIAGSFVLLFGTIALVSTKGGHLHRLGGNIFFVSMLLVSFSAMYLDILKHEIPVIGILTAYLIVTSWVTVKRQEGTIGLFEKMAFCIISVVAIAFYGIGWNIQSAGTEVANGVPAGMFYVFGTVAAFAAFLDLIMLIKGGVKKGHRIARHLWRMCIAMILATMSLLSQKAIIPDALHGSVLLWVPVLLLLIFMIFSLVRVLFTKWLEQNDALTANTS